ncbi:hypothetical protein LO763_21900 [Glycomyces sp. A-F 0318]|uniref:hypothetical protein n=1 Tax=Glycomyces amatae TaxID=2881355 RepID=UPI001E648B87|nr:hypothetical protein [Glycomyces amatae]MCD0446270.1 hypothetical protein [Glycomyces amatae]
MSDTHALGSPLRHAFAAARTIVLTPHLHFPHHHPAMLAAHVRFIKAIQPDLVLNLGGLCDLALPPGCDDSDQTEIMVERADAVKRDYFAAVRSGFDGDFWVYDCDTNQDDQHVCRCGPGPAGPSLFDFDGFGVHRVGPDSILTPEWSVTHTHRDMKNRLVAGGTAIALARRSDRHTLCAHTHRLGICFETTDTGPRARTLMGVEVGHMVDEKQLQPSPGYARPQAGFGILESSGDRLVPVTIPMQRSGGFVYNGERFT